MTFDIKTDDELTHLLLDVAREHPRAGAASPDAKRVMAQVIDWDYAFVPVDGHVYLAREFLDSVLGRGGSVPKVSRVRCGLGDDEYVTFEWTPDGDQIVVEFHGGGPVWAVAAVRLGERERSFGLRPYTTDQQQELLDFLNVNCQD
jgi:hypothetical protein